MQQADILFIHGWCFDNRIWQDFIKFFTPKHRCITVNLINLYEQGIYDIDQLSEHLLAGIDKPSIIIAWSFGGLIATNMSLKNPQKVLKVINIASSLSFRQDIHWPGIEEKLLNNFTNLCRKNLSKCIDLFIKYQLIGPPNRKYLTNKLLASFNIEQKHSLTSLVLFSQIDLRNKAADLKVNTLYIFAELDPLIPVELAKIIPKYNKKIISHVIKHSGHATFISHAESCKKVIEGYLYE